MELDLYSGVFMAALFWVFNDKTAKIVKKFHRRDIHGTQVAYYAYRILTYYKGYEEFRIYLSIHNLYLDILFPL